MAKQTVNSGDWDRLITDYDRLVAQVLAMRERIINLRHSAQVTTRAQLVALAEILAKRFNEGELQVLCFHLDVDLGDLSAEGKINKTIELVRYLERHHRIPDLIAAGKKVRSDISWDDASLLAPEASTAHRSSPWEK